MPPPTVCPVPRVVSSSKEKPPPFEKYDVVSKRITRCYPPLPEPIFLEYVGTQIGLSVVYSIPIIADVYRWTLNYEIQNAGQGGGGGGNASLTLDGGGGGGGGSGQVIAGTYTLPYGAGGTIEIIISPVGFRGLPGISPANGFPGSPPPLNTTLTVNGNLIDTSTTPTLSNGGQYASDDPTPGISSGNGGAGGAGGTAPLGIGSEGQDGGVGHATITITAGG